MNSLAIINYVSWGLCILLTSICVALRFYARHNVWKSIGREECGLSHLLSAETIVRELDMAADASLQIYVLLHGYSLLCTHI
jgi:hypothetical protein